VINQQHSAAIAYAESQRGKETLCGHGSTMFEARHTIDALRQTIGALSIKSIVDIACGDFNWMKFVDLSGIEYLGCDINESFVFKNRLVAPSHTFRSFNAITDVPPKADLIICRDLLIHLTLEHGLACLENIKKSGSTYLMINSYPNVTQNKDIENLYSKSGYGWREINIQLNPFCLSPIMQHDEYSSSKKLFVVLL
jgi:hypothetical protein